MPNLIQAPVFNGTIELDGQMPVEFSPEDIAVPNQFPTVSGLNVSNTTVFLVNATVSGALGSTSLTVSGTGVTGVVAGMGVQFSTDYSASYGPVAISGIVPGCVTVLPITDTTIHISNPLTAPLVDVSIGFYNIPTPCNFPSSNAEPSAKAGAARATYPQVPSVSLAYIPEYDGPIGG